MIYEYAIEPELLVDWGKNRADYQYFIEKFGLGSPRIMSEFPKFKNWRKQFKQAAGMAESGNELTRTRITELFKIIQEKRICREEVEYNGKLSWLQNAEEENIRKEFHAILAKNNPRCHSKVVSSKSIEIDSIGKIKNQIHCPRRPADMANLFTPILENCNEVHFVDPYFTPERSKWMKPLEAFLKIISNRVCRPGIKEIVCHTTIPRDKREKKKFSAFKQCCEKKLNDIIPTDTSLTVQYWKERGGGEKFHNRYLLTDIGGLKVDPGFDEGNVGENIEVMLLERNLYEKIWKNFFINPAYDIDTAGSPIQITGQKKLDSNKT